MSAKKPPEGNNRFTRDLVITNKLGIHARPAALFARLAGRFHADIFIEKDGETVNGKSIMGLLMLAAGPGSKLTLHADGADASQALNELEGLLRLFPILDDPRKAWPQAFNKALEELKGWPQAVNELEGLIREEIRRK